MRAEPTTAAIVVAAGMGLRLGAEQPKALVPVAGRPLLAWALDGLADAAVPDVIVVGPPGRLSEIRRWSGTARVVAGGVTRQESVSAGLAAVPADAGYVLVHDAARCFTPPATIRAVLDALRSGHRVAVPAVAVVDTLRAREGGVVDRSALVAVQTPQGFHREVLERAHEGADPQASDDALLAERQGEHVHLVEGSELAFKVTTPLDLRLAEAVASGLASGPQDDRLAHDAPAVDTRGVR